MTDGLLLIHAFPLDARMWQPQLDAIVGIQAIAPDLPGFGGAEPSGDVMTMGDAAARCVRALDEARLERAVVCGLSMGGYVALELWRSARARIAGLVLANTRAGADAPDGAAGRRALAARLRSEGNVLVDAPPPLLSEDASPELVERVRGWIGDQDPEAIAAAALGMAERPDSTQDLAGIDVPTLVITSEQDRLIPPDVSTAMSEQIRGAELAVISDAGHLSNLEAPERFDELLRLHLRRCGVIG